MGDWKRAACALALGIGLVVGATSARAADSLEGVYQVEGSNPGEATKYKGTAKVSFNGEVFEVVWNLSGQEIKGTGLKLGDTFAVSAQMPDGKPAGIMLFLLRPDGGMTGRWASAGATRTGNEIWVPQAAPGAAAMPAPTPQ
jgi:hypothetical protein